MNVTEVQIKLEEDPDAKVLAYWTLVLDDALVVRDGRVLKGEPGPFIAFPSRKATVRCPECDTKNVTRARYCNWCGFRQAPIELAEGQSLYHDVVHPINQESRSRLCKAILDKYEEVRNGEGLPVRTGDAAPA